MCDHMVDLLCVGVQRGEGVNLALNCQCKLQSVHQSANESTHIISKLINQSVNGSDIVTRLFADLKVR